MFPCEYLPIFGIHVQRLSMNVGFAQNGNISISVGGWLVCGIAFKWPAAGLNS